MITANSFIKFMESQGVTFVDVTPKYTTKNTSKKKTIQPKK